MPDQPSSKSSHMVSWQLELGDSQMLPSNGAPPESSLPPEVIVTESFPFTAVSRGVTNMQLTEP